MSQWWDVLDEAIFAHPHLTMRSPEFVMLSQAFASRHKLWLPRFHCDTFVTHEFGFTVCSCGSPCVSASSHAFLFTAHPPYLSAPWAVLGLTRSFVLLCLLSVCTTSYSIRFALCGTHASLRIRARSSHASLLPNLPPARRPAFLPYTRMWGNTTTHCDMVSHWWDYLDEGLFINPHRPCS